MQVKKNPDLDLTRNSGLYFTIGLCLMLFVTKGLLNYKTYDKQDIALELLQMEEVDEEEIPITEQILTPPPPPPPPAAPEVITVVEDVVEIEETIIESTETSMEDAIEEREVYIDDVNVEELEEDVSVPFAVVEKVPVWPGCKGKNNTELRKCFQKKMNKHVMENFKYPEIALEMGVHGRVFILFNINSDGQVTNIKTRGPDKVLEKEAARIISLVPNMIPGKQRGRNVSVPYSLPISFTMVN
ncbi:energy transducer TonB [Flavobacteriaceae sp. LMIT009]